MAGVTPNGINYPDGASKAKNLGPELEQMALDIDTYIGSYLRPDGPIRQIVIDIAEDVVPPIVEQEITKHGLVTAIPGAGVPTSTWDSVPLAWEWREESFTHSDTYSDVYTATWTDRGRRSKKVPLLRADNGKLPESVIPHDVARLSDIPDAPTPMAERVIDAARWPIFAARVAQDRVLTDPSAVVFVGSSTTAAKPGYVRHLTGLLQDTYPDGARSSAQWSTSAQWTMRTASGLHAYNAGQGSTKAADYLTDEECDRIAALDPACIVHMIGSNDYTGQTDPAAYESAMIARLSYLDSVLPNPTQHILAHAYARLNFTPPTFEHSQYLTALENVAAGRDDTGVIDLSASYRTLGIPGSDALGLISADDVHQNAQGYRFMAVRLASELLT